MDSAWARLPRCLSKGTLKRDFLNVYLTTFYEDVILFLIEYPVLNRDVMSLFRTGSLSAAANVLRRSPKNLHVKKKDFPNLISLAVTNEYDKYALMQIANVPRNVYHVACRKVF